MRIVPRFVMLVLLAVSAISTSGQSKDSVAIESLVRSQIEAQTAYDRAKLDEITTADYIEVSPVGEVDARPKMLDFYKAELKPKEVQVTTTVSEVSIRTYDNFAIAIVRIDYQINRGTRALPPRGVRATFVTRKEKKTWKVVSAHYTGIRPPQR